jgi:hypothetical protein
LLPHCSDRHLQLMLPGLSMTLYVASAPFNKQHAKLQDAPRYSERFQRVSKARTLCRRCGGSTNLCTSRLHMQGDARSNICNICNMQPWILDYWQTAMFFLCRLSVTKKTNSWDSSQTESSGIISSVGDRNTICELSLFCIIS